MSFQNLNISQDELLAKLKSGELVVLRRETLDALFPMQVVTPATESLPPRDPSIVKDHSSPSINEDPAARAEWHALVAMGAKPGMDRSTADYKEAVQRVKISYLTENLGLDIKGIIHVGTNDGYEMQWYKKMGIRNLIGVEPLRSAQDAFLKQYPDIPLMCCALGERSMADLLNIAAGDGQGSSLLLEIGGKKWSLTETVKVERWDSIANYHHVNMSLYDCLVMDVQGFELQALKGFGDTLDYIKYISVELSKEPIYQGGAPAAEVIDYLNSRGFVQMSRTEEHNDVFFVREGQQLHGLCLNIGSGQRPFGEPWINIDCNDKWKPHIVADGAHLPMFPSGSARTIVLHHVLEHFGCGEAKDLIQECYRLLQADGSLIVTAPDMRVLAYKWAVLAHPDINTQLYMTNVYGAFMDDEADRHKWGYDMESLTAFLGESATWKRVGRFNFRKIPGADIAQDWWILGCEAMK